jgi:hypothetical protein
MKTFEQFRQWHVAGAAVTAGYLLGWTLLSAWPRDPDPQDPTWFLVILAANHLEEVRFVARNPTLAAATARVNAAIFGGGELAARGIVDGAGVALGQALVAEGGTQAHPSRSAGS